MSPRLALAAALLAFAGLGLVWGRASLPPSESAVIEAVAADYVAAEGGQRTDCAARPGIGEAWLVVTCEGAEGRFVYPVDRRGRPATLPEGGA